MVLLAKKANAIFKCYLTERDQFVVFKRAKSDLISIYTGVPQDTVHRPLLFSMYINNFPESTSIFNVLRYVDDTMLYCNINQIPIEGRSFILSSVLNRIHEVLACNKLSLNVEKENDIHCFPQ